MSKTQKNTTPSEQAETPPWRTVATVLILLHLFCLGLGVVSNAGRVSAIRGALGNVPVASSYLQMLGMDRSYEFPLAGASPQDGQHMLVASGESDRLPVSLPAEEMSRLRRARYETLAFWTAQFDRRYEENTDARTELPHQVASTWLDSLGIDSGTYELTCLRQAPIRWQDEGEASEDSTEPESLVLLKLLWDEPARDLLVTLVEEASQTSAVVDRAETEGQPTAKEQP